MELTEEIQILELAGTMGSAKKEELEAGDRNDSEANHCSSVSVGQNPDICTDVERLQIERDVLRSAVDNLYVEIEQFSSEKKNLLLMQGVLNDELHSLKASLHAMEDEKSTLSETHTPEEKTVLLLSEGSLHTEIENATLERQSLLLRKANLEEELKILKTCVQVMEDEKKSLAEAKLQVQEEKNILHSDLDSFRTQIQQATSEKHGLLATQGILED